MHNTGNKVDTVHKMHQVHQVQNKFFINNENHKIFNNNENHEIFNNNENRKIFNNIMKSQSVFQHKPFFLNTRTLTLLRKSLMSKSNT